MGKHVVAEGIEVEEQRRLLTGFGCEYAQGYLFSKPVSAEEFVALTRGWNPMHSLVSLGVAVDGAPVEAGSESMAMQPARP
jgi:predicted signal transduction protein with EAL and GGDEF domain